MQNRIEKQTHNSHKSNPTKFPNIPPNNNTYGRSIAFSFLLWELVHEYLLTRRVTNKKVLML